MPACTCAGSVASDAAAPANHSVSNAAIGSAKPGSTSSTRTPSVDEHVDGRLERRRHARVDVDVARASRSPPPAGPRTGASSAAAVGAAGASAQASRASAPDTTSSSRAASATVRVIGPTCDSGPNGLAG